MLRTKNVKQVENPTFRVKMVILSDFRKKSYRERPFSTHRYNKPDSGLKGA